MICGILKTYTLEKIEFSNHKWSRNDLAYIGTLIETPPLYENLTAYENLKVRAELLKLSDERIREVLENCRIEKHRKKTSRSIFIRNETTFGNCSSTYGKTRYSDIG